MAAQRKRAWVFPTTGGPDFVFDIVVRESHKFSVKISDNPVETGEVMSDHAVVQPETLEIEGWVSDTPLHPEVAAVFNGQASRSQTAWDMLCGLASSREPFTVVTGLKIYTDMMIESLQADQDASTSGVLAFQASLRRVQRATTQTVTYPTRKPGATHRQASKPVKEGEKKATEETDPSKRDSFAFGLTGRPKQAGDIIDNMWSGFKAHFGADGSAEAP